MKILSWGMPKLTGDGPVNGSDPAKSMTNKLPLLAVLAAVFVLKSMS